MADVTNTHAQGTYVFLSCVYTYIHKYNFQLKRILIEKKIKKKSRQRNGKYEKKNLCYICNLKVK